MSDLLNEMGYAAENEHTSFVNLQKVVTSNFTELVMFLTFKVTEQRSQGSSPQS